LRSLVETAESLRIALGAIRTNKARGVLTTLGIIIGIVGVVTTMTAANGLSQSFKNSVSALGSDVLYVSRTPWIVMGNFFQFRNRPNLTLRQSEQLEHHLADAVAVNPTAHTTKKVKFQSTVLDDVDIIGTTEKQMSVSSSVPDLGRFLTGNEVVAARHVCVIGAGINDRLFTGADPLNQTIKIGRYAFRVIGVMEKQGGSGFFGGPDFDAQIYVPISAFTKDFGGTNRDFNIAVKAPSTAALGDFEYEVIGEMRKVRRLKPVEGDDFSINRMDALVGMFNKVMGVVLIIGMVITSISLFVGGIGVMNIMFVSVTERTREIGVRKAIGAPRRAILTQFLFEASAICLLGGLLGLAAAYGVTALINKLLMPASISLPIAGVAIAVAVGTGIVAGMIPAIRASRLNPIEALRYE
jgi:putative ABC transport system permease protein